MTQHIALLGAGFSKNWGGWLAREAFEYLIGVPELQAEPNIIGSLWDHQETGGFEQTLSVLQTAAKTSPTPYGKQLALLENAVVKMFADMNAGFVDQSFRFSHETREFLVRFDAIFTLNQDILLERQYMSGVFPLGGGPKRWNGAYLPGVTSPYAQAEYEPQRWLQDHWRVVPVVPTKLERRTQPIIKLHGSSLWRRDIDQRGVLIIGGHKSDAIDGDPLLKWYRQQFKAALMQPDTRLMIIGYGFRDPHINAMIEEAGHAGLQVFNVHPDGAKAWIEGRDGDAGPDNRLRPMLIGASQRPLPETVRPGSAEHNKVMRFFA